MGYAGLRRRIEYLILIAAVLILAMPGIAKAAGTHGEWATSNGSCWTCHRAHTAVSEGLLTSGLLCRTCHEGALAADCDVINGMYIDALNADHSWGNNTVGYGTPGYVDEYDHEEPDGRHLNKPLDKKLLGGGFEHIAGALAPAATSNHSIGQTVVPFGSTSGASIVLECTSCHTIHHNFAYPQQYRMLRAQVGDATTDLPVEWNGPWEGPAQMMRKGGEYMAYTETDFSGGPYPYDEVEYTRNYKSGLSAWCTGCHGVYISPVGPYDIGDGNGPTVKHRHKVDITLANTGPLMGNPATDLPLNDLGNVGHSPEDTMTCLTCHRAHGTDTDSTAVGAFQAAGRGILPQLNTSMLLRRDNRGVCIDCHAYLNDL